MVADDRLADLVGVALVAFIVLALAVLVLAAATAPSRQPVEPPAAEWTLQRVDVGHVGVTHAGGDPVDASRLVVAVAGVERAHGTTDRLTRGDSITVPARAGQVVELYWVGGRDERVRLAEWRAP